MKRWSVRYHVFTIFRLRSRAPLGNMVNVPITSCALTGEKARGAKNQARVIILMLRKWFMFLPHWYGQTVFSQGCFLEAQKPSNKSFSTLAFLYARNFPELVKIFPVAARNFFTFDNYSAVFLFTKKVKKSYENKRKNIFISPPVEPLVTLTSTLFRSRVRGNNVSL